MIGLGDRFPTFDLAAVHRATVCQLTQRTFDGRWRVYFSWPQDFTPVCASEIVEFSQLHNEFCDRDTQVIGVSTDSEVDHIAWKQNLNVAIPFPMLSDVHGKLSRSLGIFDTNRGFAQRATFIVDAENVVRFLSVNDFAVGRNPTEVLRTLDALQTRRLCPSSWRRGQAHLDTKVPSSGKLRA